MASREVAKLPSDSKDLASVSAEMSQCGPDDIMEEPQLDTMNTTVKSQKSGKFRRTALTFFGVRKNICILPNFFGGRSKNLSKWSSKKAINKSRTHDGLSNLSHDDNPRSGYNSAGDLVYQDPRGSAGELHSSCHNECSHLGADQKSLTRQKRGFRSLFQSFRYHRNHRNAGLDKPEMIAMSSPRCKKEVPVVQDNTKQYVTECLESEPDVPDFADVSCDLSIGAECVDAVEMSSQKGVEQDSPKSELGAETCDNEMSLMAVVFSELKESSRGHSEPCLKLETMAEPLLKSETPAGSSDQLNMIYGDVASLKSFDSLTGCGDIIADQEDDSITESTVSGERSRSGGKRASCYLTYQGGGEEMASPEDLDGECLQDFWGNTASEEMCYTCNQDITDLTADLTSSHDMDLLNSNSAQQASGMDASSMADALTPQSEHQESVPTSDEGYYDSTTPGPDDRQESSDRLRGERLPRDSYSGDALYELFAPDESLISPHYENKSKLPGSKQYLSEPVDVTDSAFVPDMNRLQISGQLYEVHGFPERPSTCSRSSESAQKAMGRQEIGRKNCNLNSKPQTSANKNNTEPNVFEDKGNMSPPSSEKITKSVNAEREKRHSIVSFGSTSDPDFETFCEPKEQHLEENKPVALPYKNISSQSAVDINDSDDGQTVCFSQALVDYTKHSQMLSNLHNDGDDLETNSAFTSNMQALPTIVTFDVVDMHNEGEYDEQIHMELEEDISSPYQDFEESYLQKDAFAECDYQMLDMYEQNLISNTWAIASLPRHLGLTRVSQSMPNASSLDRRSRSLDRESLDLKMLDTYRENRAAIVASPQSETDSSTYYKRNVLVSASEVIDRSSIMALSWQTRSEMALSLPLTDGGFTEKVQSLSQTQVKSKIMSSSSSSKSPSSKTRLCSKVSDKVSCDVNSQNNRQQHLPSQADSCLPHSPFLYSGMMDGESDDVDEDVFCKAATHLHSYNKCGKSRPVDAASHTGSLLNTGGLNDDMAVLSETRTPRDVAGIGITCVCAINECFHVTSKR
ncbi:APC membrane recruitment protein 1 [Pseudochaenichthys georgianus]|uniref:APC membrane recruitment protein 1 n=1 Tax=Pseudochaenichthys georgianus TaxID=52239 RepID=UPI00146F6841|nr:APC membrane recruitment protein 1 [Pseudochaenichthys georgianus]XP_033955293.1 APC membrane recruitment protein 1 [Pseudochaenichthys georgianus]